MNAPAVHTLYFEDLRAGMRETLMRTVMDDDVLDFARISGDDNPIHLSDAYAARTRFGQRIAHGMLSGSFISTVIGTKLPGPGADGGARLRAAPPAAARGLVGHRLAPVPLIHPASRRP